MDSSCILGDDTILKGFSLSQVCDCEVVLCDRGVVALEPAVVVPLICAVDLPLHNVADDLIATIVEGYSPAQRNRGAADVGNLRFTRRIYNKQVKTL